MSETECPTCGEEFTNEHGMKIHHKRIHNESIAGGLVECSWCGDTLRRRLWPIENYDEFFCGNGDCRRKWRSENLTGENATPWEGGKQNVECHWCGDDLKRGASQVEKYERFFCYDENLGWSRCQAEWRSENYGGENNPLWEGGKAPYGEGWSESKRESVRESQNRRCASCGVHESNFEERLDVHHIIPAREFDDPEKRNDESNLVAMCRSCHMGKWEGIPLRPQLAD